MTFHRSFLPLLAALIGAVVSSCTNPKSPSAWIEVGDPFYLEVLKVQGNTASGAVWSNNRTERTSFTRRKLTPQQLEEFWSELDAGAVECWKSKYVRTVDDGRTAYGSWSISVNRNGVVHCSQGDAYPSDADPQVTVQLKESCRFERVWHAFCTAVSPLP